MNDSPLHRLARAVLRLEPLILAGIGLALWYPSRTRAEWLWTLLLLIPLLAARFVLYRRLWTPTPLDPWCAALLLLGGLNLWIAPYTRGPVILARLLWGMALYVALVDWTRRRSLDGPIRFVIAFAIGMALLALGMTDWDVKSAGFQALINLLPRLDWPALTGGFSPNEIGGAMAWLAPLMAGLALYRWRTDGLRWPPTLAFGLLTLALILGQSRVAIAGVLVGLGLIGFSLPNPRLRRLLRITVVGLVVLELGLAGARVIQDFETMNFTPGEFDQDRTNLALSYVRDVASFSGRLEVWNSAAAMIRQNPLTGTGIDTFPLSDVHDAFAVPDLDGIPAPHAHNEVLQILADMGLPGAVIFCALYLVAAGMLWRGFQSGDDRLRMLSVALAGGLLAHAVFGLVDAITLWDRLAFVFWLMLGLSAAVYTQAVSRAAAGVQSGAMNVMQADFHIRRSLPERLKAYVLLGLGLYFVYLILAGNLSHYVNLRFSWLSYVGAALFLLLGLASLRQPDTHAHEHHAHEEHEHDHSLISWPVLLVVALPLILGTLVPSQALGAAAVDGDFSASGMTTDSYNGYGVAPEDRNILDWLRAFNASEDRSGFAGQPVDLIGFVYQDDSYASGQFMVARFAISCCVADSVAVGLPVEWSQPLDSDTWVHITGTFKLDSFQGETQPVIAPDTVEVIEEPDQPYLYP